MSSPRGHQHSPLKPNPAALCKPQSLMKRSFKEVIQAHVPHKKAAWELPARRAEGL